MSGTITRLTINDELTRRKHAEAIDALIDGEVRFGEHDRMLYATDASIYQVEPIGVVIPRDIEDVRQVVRYCVAHGLPVLPRGGGTSLAGQCVNHAIVLDFSAHVKKLKRIDAAGARCVVEPGITIEDLNDELRAHGLFFAPDPATARHANVGGCIGNNAAGTRSVVYGRTSENVESVDVLLADGREYRLDGAASDDPELVALRRRVGEVCLRHAELIRERFPKTIRRNAGYGLDMLVQQLDTGVVAEQLDLAPLICGAEGTLGIVTRATLKLHPIPTMRGLGVVGFASLSEAIDAVIPLLELKPSALELLDDLVIEVARGNLYCREMVEFMPQPPESRLEAVLYVEFSVFEDDLAGAKRALDGRFEALRRLIGERFAGAGVACFADQQRIAAALQLRKSAEPLLHGLPGHRKPLGFVEDNAVPVERLSEFVSRFRAILERHQTRGAFFAHASVGVLHVRPLLDLRDEHDRVRMEQVAVEVADLAKELGGVMSGEHGDGRVRGPLLERFFGAELMGAFREIKEIFDPGYVLNPGNIVPLPGAAVLPIESIHEQTRVRPAGANVMFPDVATYFDYVGEGGFDHAIELCNGSGVCRKKQTGTMCPSYMATLDERHSTRGRGNAIRLAISGQMGGESEEKQSMRTLREGMQPGAERGNGTDPKTGQWHGAPNWNDVETLATLDLCLSCKACKSECPTNVDMAKYKAEYLAQSYDAAGRIPLRAKLFSDVHRINRIGSGMAPVSNWIAGSWPVRAMHRRLVGLSMKRSVPRFARSLMRQATDPRFCRGEGLSEQAPVVVLFADCFTAYNEPSIGLATIRLLHAFGYNVVIESGGCCGRAAISMGVLGKAIGMVAETRRRLLVTMASTRAVGVVACEPSCVSAITDDWQSLGVADGERVHLGEAAREISDLEREVSARDASRWLSDRAMLPEQFIERYWEQHPRRPEFRVGDGRVLLHAHCHQKALWGVESSAALLRRVCGSRLEVLDAGCCGMAGSFGYTEDHYHLSMSIGELSLFPAVRGLGEGDVLLATGTSCRHQVHDGASIVAQHPMVYLAEAAE